MFDNYNTNYNKGNLKHFTKGSYNIFIIHQETNFQLVHDAIIFGSLKLLRFIKM